MKITLAVDITVAPDGTVHSADSTVEVDELTGRELLLKGHARPAEDGTDVPAVNPPSEDAQGATAPAADVPVIPPTATVEPVVQDAPKLADVAADIPTSVPETAPAAASDVPAELDAPAEDPAPAAEPAAADPAPTEDAAPAEPEATVTETPAAPVGDATPEGTE